MTQAPPVVSHEPASRETQAGLPIADETQADPFRAAVAEMVERLIAAALGEPEACA